MQPRGDIAQHLAEAVVAQPPIALELRFAVELVERRLVRKRGMLALVILHVGRLVAREGGLDVDQHAHGGLGIDAVVADRADRAVPFAAAVVQGHQLAGVDLD